MSDTKDGGPAFPSDWAPLGGQATQGMSLRDWFAGQALSGVLAIRLKQLGECLNSRLDSTDGGADYDCRATARAAYKIADALLAERAKRDSK